MEYMFVYKGNYYITTRDTISNYNSMLCKFLSGDEKTALKEYLENPVYIHVIDAWEPRIGDLSIKAELEKDGKKYIYNSDIKELIEDIKEVDVPEEVFTTNTPIDLDLLKSDGDMYCIENNWTYFNSYYYILYTKFNLLYIHSDKNNYDIVKGV